MKQIDTYDLILSIGTGALFSITFLVPYSGILSWFLLIPLFSVIKSKESFAALVLGTLSGAVAYAIGAYWLVGTINKFGRLPLSISFIYYFLVCAYSGISFGISTYIITKLDLLRKGGITSALVIASLWISIEYFYPFLFPFTIANPQADFVPLIQISDLLGIYSVSFIIVFVNVALFRLFTGIKEKAPIRYREISASIIIVAVTITYGLWRMNAEEETIARAARIRVGLVQANFDIFEKNEDNMEVIYERHKSLSKLLNSPDIIIWPETAIQSWTPGSSKLLEEIVNISIANTKETYFLVGGASLIAEEDLSNKSEFNKPTKHNTAFLTDSDGKILGKYYKIKLFPFGEYVPFSNQFPILRKLSPHSNDLNPGNRLNLLEIEKRGVRIAPLICYEDTIPSFSRKLANMGANLLVNLTNDALFGESPAAYQHLLISIPRAVETRLYFVRSTNTGITAIIDPIGRVVGRADPFVEANLEGVVGILEGSNTVYTRIGYVFPWLCAIFWVGYGLIFYSKQK
jgi:apolipoprotein N-acyltransferase